MFTGFVQTNEKSLTKEVVKEAALALLTQNGTTTTLEVKNYLRNANNFSDNTPYWAEQAVVSRFMSELAAEGVFGSSIENGHKVFSLTTTTNVADTNTVNVAAPTLNANSNVITTGNRTFECSNPSTNVVLKVVAANHNEARRTFSKSQNVNYWNTNARLVK